MTSHTVRRVMRCGKRFLPTVCGVLVVIACFLPTTPASATTYTIDLDHTTVSFKIRHLFSYVQGWFTAVEGMFDYVPEDPSQWRAQATIHAESIDTRVKQRDEHLRSKDFFDVEQFPTITFKSTEITEATPGSAKLHGLLTIHGVEKPVILDLTIHGEGKDPWGNVRSGFTATTMVHRSDFGLTWNKLVETGQALVGDEVEITLDVEGIVKP